MKKLYTLGETSEKLNLSYKDVILLGQEGIIEVYEYDGRTLYNFDMFKTAVDYFENSLSSQDNQYQTKNITEFGLSVRVLNRLTDLEVNTISDLSKIKRNELVKLQGFGPKSMLEVETLLKRFNLYLK